MLTFAGILLTRCKSVVMAWAILFFASAVFAAPLSSHLAPPSGLRCDGQAEPLAVADQSPEFSWTDDASSTALRGVRQSAYQVRVTAAGAIGQPFLWDTGKIESSQTLGVVYRGLTLEAGHAYTWQVRVWDEDGHSTAWSQPAHWTQAPKIDAEWIAAAATDAEADEQPMPLFRKSFTLPAPVTRAMLYASGMGQDELRINGRKVSSDVLTPGWSDYRKTVFYDSYDVTALLHAGGNAIGVMLGNGMYRVLKTPGRYTKFTGSFGPPKCIVQLTVDLANGETVNIASDGSWKTAPGPINFSSTYGGEDYDARREPAHWDQSGYDDARWTHALVTTSPGGTLRPELAPPIRVMHVHTPVKITQPRPGVFVYDLGQNFAGWPAIAVRGPAGATVKLIPGELLNKDGTVSQRSSGRPEWFTYTLKGGGIEHWHPRFSYYGFRYVQVEGAVTGSAAGAAGKPRLLALRGEAVHTSSAPVGSFASSDQLLNRIHTLILRAIENNAVSIFTDCPHREKLGWLEETHLMAPSMLYDFNFAGLYAATARNIADAQTQSGAKAGLVPEIAPQYVVFKVDNGVFDDSPEWGSAAVLAPWYVFQRTGDRRFLAAQLGVMGAYTAYLGTRAHNGIISYGLGDWYDIGPGEPGISKLTTPGVTGTATYYQDLRVMERATALLGLDEESRHFQQLAEQERAAFNARFFDTEHHRYDKGSQTAQAMPLALGMVPEHERAHVLQALVDDIRAHNNHVTAGDVGFRYVVDALIEGGRSDVLLDMLERTDAPSYGDQLAQGATSLTEAWDADPRSSQDHLMLGHAEEWFYRGLGGINVNLSAAPPRQIVLNPYVPARIAWVRCSYRSALGLIQSNWRRGPAQTAYSLIIPANATVTVEVPTAAPESVKIGGLSPAQATGVQSSKATADGLELVLGSGSYRIVAANPRPSSR